MFLKQKFLLWGQSKIEKGAFFLAPFSVFYKCISWIKNFCYDYHIFKSIKVNVPVVSVGNIVAGGTGKTPLIHFLVSFFKNRKVAILSRGYGDIADEAIMLQKKLPFAKVYVGKDRVNLAKLAQNEGCEIIFLDDGLQKRKLFRDFDLAIVRGNDPYGKGHFLPWGFLRDSPKRLNQVDVVFSNGSMLSKMLKPVIELNPKYGKILNFYGNELQIKKEKIPIFMFCAIARPDFFRQALKQLGFFILEEFVLFDHEKPSTELFQRFKNLAKQKIAAAIICTEKDFARLATDQIDDGYVYYLEMSFEVAQGQEHLQNLIEKIQKKLNNAQPL